LGIPSVLGLGNKAANSGDTDFFVQLCAEQGVRLAGIIPYDSDIASANRLGTRVDLGLAHPVRAELDRVVVLLDEVLASTSGLA
jgi:CO dehydrogenase maturation factor